MPVGVQCPLSFSLGEFPSYWDWLRCPGLSPVLCPSPFPSPSIHVFGVFHSLLSAIGFQSCFFFTADVSPPIFISSVLIITIIHSFIHSISIAPLQVHYYSEALPTQHGYCARVSRRSATGNCE